MKTDVYLVPCIDCGRERPILASSASVANAWTSPCNWCRSLLHRVWNDRQKVLL